MSKKRVDTSKDVSESTSNELKKFAETIIKGVKPIDLNIFWFASNDTLLRRDVLTSQLLNLISGLEDNANCMYHTYLLYDQQGKKEEADVSLKKAIELGSLDAKFDFLVKEYESGSNRDLFVHNGLELVRGGYRLKRHFNVKYFLYYSMVLEKFVDELQEKLVEEQLRPPEHGGSEFENAKTHFESVARN